MYKEQCAYQHYLAGHGRVRVRALDQRANEAVARALVLEQPRGRELVLQQLAEHAERNGLCVGG